MNWRRLPAASIKCPPVRARSASSSAQVPFFPQEDYYCGPASLAMVLAWTGLDVNQDQIAPEVYTPGRVGTLQPDILTAARRHGRLAVQVNTLHDMLKELAAGNPVLV